MIGDFFLNKKGQFYLLASIIIVGILIGLVTVQNYSFEKSISRVDDFADELRIEGEKVLDYDKKNGANEFENFAKNYSEYIGESIKIYFIFGDLNDVKVYSYVNGAKERNSYDLNENDLSVSLEGDLYNFKLNKGDNFHFVMFEPRDIEKYVVVK